MTVPEKKAEMQLPTRVYPALLAVAAIALALLPVPAAAEMATTTGGCQQIEGGLYYDFTAKQFCEVVGAAAGGGPSGGSKGGGGSTATELSKGLIVIHDPTEGSIYCGSLTDDFVSRPQDCRRPSGRNGCSSTGGCAGCSADGCITPGGLRGSSRHAQRSKQQTRTRELSQAEKLENCRALAADDRAITLRYAYVFKFALRHGFTWDEIEEGLIWNLAKMDPDDTTIGIRNKSGTVAVTLTLDRGGLGGKIRDFISTSTRVTLALWPQCSEFGDIKLSRIRDIVEVPDGPTQSAPSDAWSG